MKRELRSGVRDANGVAWLVLMAATALAWWWGRAAQGAGDEVRIAMAGVILTATFKVGIVGWQFMELKTAPRWLQLAFAAWLVGISAVLVVISCG